MSTSQASEQLGFPDRLNSAPSAGHFNLLILNTHLPVFPGGGGVEYLTTKNLARVVDRIAVASMAHTRNDLNTARSLEAQGVNLYIWESPGIDLPPHEPSSRGILRTLHLLLQRAVATFKAWPDRPIDTIIMDGCFRNMSAGIFQALSSTQWHVVSCIQSTAARMIDYMPRPLVSVLVMHDIRAVMYERSADYAPSFWSAFVARRQARRYRAFERHYCQQYDLVVAVSKNDADWLRRHYKPRKVITVPLPVDAAYFHPQHSTREIPGRIVFTGLMSHPPNADAAVYFARHVFPLIRRSCPDSEFFIVGRDPTPRIKALNALPAVHVTGGVPDIRPYIAEATVVVVPLRFGSGARQKILEAFGMNKCVVSTTVGAEGLEYEHDVNILIADRTNQLAATVVDTLQNPDLRDRIRMKGRQTVIQHHNPEQIARDYAREIAEVLTSKSSLEAPMRVALDLRWMLPGLAGGLENLVRSFLPHLLSIDRHNFYTLVLPARCRFDFDTRRNPNVKTISTDSFGNYLRRLARSAQRSLSARLHLDYWQSSDVLTLRFLRSLDADIVYSFTGYIQPDTNPLRHFLLIPDLQHEYHPEFFSPQALEERQRLYLAAARRADHICAISEYTRGTVIDRFGIPPDKITTIHLAPDPRFSPVADRSDGVVLNKYGLERHNYLFFPAHTWRHKNHRTAIEVIRILRDRYQLPLSLVCSGGAREAQADLDEQIGKYRLTDSVRFLGYCAASDLPALYRNAVSLLFPSIFEGFAMPVIEAMASGCPVVCSNTTSLPEIAGGAALMRDPCDAEEMAAAVHNLYRDPLLRTELVEQGQQRASQFSWRRHTLEVITLLYKLHRRLRLQSST